jgi:hypothetical protein
VCGEVVEARTSPNQGTHRSARTALTAVLILGLTGGLFSLRHFVLRLSLRMNGLAPLHYVRFLDHAVERLFLRKGGGYIFIHRVVMEHFASLAEP